MKEALLFLLFYGSLLFTGFVCGYLYARKNVRRWTHEEWDRLDRERATGEGGCPYPENCQSRCSTPAPAERAQCQWSTHDGGGSCDNPAEIGLCLHHLSMDRSEAVRDALHAEESRRLEDTPAPAEQDDDCGHSLFYNPYERRVSKRKPAEQAGGEE